MREKTFAPIAPIAAFETETEAIGLIHFLVHHPSDDVGVAVVDIPAGAKCLGRDLTTNQSLQSLAAEDIPLGHKLALRDFEIGDVVTKYGREIGKVVEPIKAGQHVHVHNLKTKRWA